MATPKGKTAAKPATATVTKTPATPAPVAKAPAAPAPAAKAATPVLTKAAAAPAKAAAKPAVDPAKRQAMIAEAAYYIAEKRGFAPGNHDADWAEAERQLGF